MYVVRRGRMDRARPKGDSMFKSYNQAAVLVWLPEGVDPEHPGNAPTGQLHQIEPHWTLSSALSSWRAQRGMSPGLVGWIKTGDWVLTEGEMVRASEAAKLAR